MLRARILRNLMEEQHLKVADLAKKTGLAYSTVKSILENGIEKTSYVNVCKICDALGISIDQLEELVSAENPTKKVPTYEDVELLIARNGKAMSKEQKLRLIQLLSGIDE